MSRYGGVVAETKVDFELPKIPPLPELDPKDEIDQRRAVIQEAWDWIGTPYHHRAGIKGKNGGVDCAFFPYRVYNYVGILPELDLGDYSPDWFLHQGSERYLEWVRQLAREVDAPAPGDFVIFKIGRLYAHGAIIIDWPHIVHALRLVGSVIKDLGDQGDLSDRDHLFFSPWGR